MCKMRKIAICMVTLMMMTGLAACSADNNTDSNVNSVTDESGNSSNSDNGKNTDNSLEKDMDHIGDDIKDGVEDVGDYIKDGVDDLGGNEKNATGSSNTSGTAR